MKRIKAASSLAALLLLASCGGSDLSSSPAALPPSLQAATVTVVNGTATFSGKRADYTVTRTDTGFIVTDNVGGSGTSTLSNVQTLRFADAVVNLTVGSKAQGITTEQLHKIIELYVAFFGRVPDADGLAYWIGRVKDGASMTQIADSFYDSAIFYSSLTGYSASMSNADFVRIVYKNVLGRSGATAPPDADVQYWANRLATGQDTRASLVTVMTTVAHDFTGNVTWGWVPQLLDNRIAVAEYFAVQQGLNYATPEESILKTTEIAAAVTPSDTTAARAKITLADPALSLTSPVIGGQAARGPLAGATVAAYALDAKGNKGNLIASTRTAADGSGKYWLQLPANTTGAVQLEVNSGTFTDPHTGKTTTNAATLATVVPAVGSTGKTGVAVNALTNMQVYLAKTLVGTGKTVAAAHEQAGQVLQWQYGLQSAPGETIPVYEAHNVLANPNGVQLGLVLTALETLANKLAPTNPHALFAALAADFADGSFDGKANGQPVLLNGVALPVTAGTTDFLAAAALVHSANGAGLRPAYVEAQYQAATLMKKYEAQAVPVYVASEVKPYYAANLATQIANTASFDGSATGYSCKSGAALSFDAAGKPKCGEGAHYVCYGNATVVTLANGRTGCSDGGIPAFIAAETPAYTAPLIKPYTATLLNGYTADLVVGKPAAGTPQMYTATTLHVFTEAERAAMMAADHAAGDLAASKVAGMPLNQAQVDAYRMINNAIFVASGNFVYKF